jgi:heme oxygenase (biliverdin-IX-beta and delta-forming)
MKTSLLPVSNDGYGSSHTRTLIASGDTPADSIHMRLKVATRLHHNQVDQSFSRFDLASAADHVAFLNLNATALSTLRPYWRSVDEADFGALVEALAVDLAEFGAALPGAIRTSVSINGLGLAYVVRGSRLGSKILRKRVPRGFPTAYLDFKTVVTWREFLLQLDPRASSTHESEHAIVDGARATFAVYEQLARREGAAA